LSDSYRVVYSKIECCGSAGLVNVTLQSLIQIFIAQRGACCSWHRLLVASAQLALGLAASCLGSHHDFCCCGRQGRPAKPRYKKKLIASQTSLLQGKPLKRSPFTRTDQTQPTCSAGKDPFARTAVLVPQALGSQGTHVRLANKRRDATLQPGVLIVNCFCKTSPCEGAHVRKAS
jgi:hypothetical protein